MIGFFFNYYRRVDKPPSKELIRLFIRAYSVRSGQNPNSPWVVDEDKVMEFSLPNKINDFFLSPVKVGLSLFLSQSLAVTIWKWLSYYF